MPDAVFATTHWSVVQRAGEAGSAEGQRALEELCRPYWFPVYAEIRCRGYAEHHVQDLTQEFFACLLRRESFAAATPAKGRFRSYLLGALDNFLSDARARDGALKRGGTRQIVSFDELDAEAWYYAEPAARDTPARAFDRHWLIAVLAAGLRALEAEQTAAGKAATFARLKPFLAVETDAGDYRQVAAEPGLKIGTVAVAVHRLRRRYQEIVRAAVQQAFPDPEDLEDELRHLFGGGP